MIMMMMMIMIKVARFDWEQTKTKLHLLGSIEPVHGQTRINYQTNWIQLLGQRLAADRSIRQQAGLNFFMLLTN